jgi:flagellar protein FlgJ
MNSALVQNTINQGMNALNGGKLNNASKTLHGKIDNGVDVKTKAAAQDFEAVFISQMLTHMFEGIKTDGMFGGGNAEDIFRSMMVDEYGKMMSKNGGIGLSDSVMSEMIEMQSKQQMGGL